MGRPGGERGAYAHPDRYESRSPGLPGDVDFYLGLARDAEGAVLELGCGTGRVTIPIAREGIAVTGLDIEPRMLELARRRSVGIGAVKWIEADMRRYTLPQRFGLIFVAYRGFLHLLEETDQRAALGCAFAITRFTQNLF